MSAQAPTQPSLHSELEERFKKYRGYELGKGGQASTSVKGGKAATSVTPEKSKALDAADDAQILEIQRAIDDLNHPYSGLPQGTGGE